MKTSVILLAALVMAVMVCWPSGCMAAPKAELWGRWQTHDEKSAERVDHSAWDGFLKKYVVTGHPSGVNRLRYSEVAPQDKKVLSDYIRYMADIRVTGLSRAEQKAYWINLYNALTVKVMLDHYPVKSIRDIDISPGWFSNGPWGAKHLKIEGEEISLDDIEHRILRPIWRDNRVHYAVNCASVGCPNIQPDAFTSYNIETLLDKGAAEYVNHRRGVHFEDGELVLSSIYDWFSDDFGGSEEGVMEHIIRYAHKPLADRLNGYSGGISYEYDWALNE